MLKGRRITKQVEEARAQYKEGNGILCKNEC